MNGIGPLPRIGAGVPHLIRPDAAHQADATLARYLLRAGVVRAADVPRAWLDPLAVCCAALERWAHAACGTLHHVAPDFHLELLKGEDAGVMLTWGARGKPQTLAIGAALEALEARVPDLGAEALWALDYQYSYRLFTPRDMLDQARSLYWYGDDDEATVLAECAGDERAEVERAMVTRAKLDAAYPAWALDEQTFQIPSRALRRLVNAPGLVGQVARVLLRMRRLGRRMRRRVARGHGGDRFGWVELDDDGHGTFLGYGVVLAWHAGPATGAQREVGLRIYDDLVDMGENDNAWFDWMGRVWLDLDQPRQLRHWLDSMHWQLQMAGLIDQLLHLIGTGY